MPIAIGIAVLLGWIVAVGLLLSDMARSEWSESHPGQRPPRPRFRRRRRRRP